jgi:hypothetical protein
LIPRYGTSTFGSAVKPCPIAFAVTSIRTWRTHVNGTPAIGKIAISATIAATTAIQRRRRGSAPHAATAIVSPSSASIRPSGAGLISVSQRSTP